jgi:hypothetical protein
VPLYRTHPVIAGRLYYLVYRIIKVAITSRTKNAGYSTLTGALSKEYPNRSTALVYPPCDLRFLVIILRLVLSIPRRLTPPGYKLVLLVLRKYNPASVRPYILGN